LFNTLRQWRAARAKAEGIPSYQIANNRQLAEMAESRPQSLTALAKLEGFGQA
jgi:ATP-dependent DNA helicase RecQ